MMLTSIVPTQQSTKLKPKLRTYPSVRISPEHLHFWHTGLMPHINHVLRGFYKKYPESVEISLESVGESSTTTKPTILVVCTSVDKVRRMLKKSLVYDRATFGLKVCRGKVVRSRKRGVKRSMASEHGGDKAANAGHQERPYNGASIGACVEGHHLPPVSFGGMIEVDGRSYGMTVHHMLENPDEADDEADDEGLEDQVPILRSSAHAMDIPDLTYSESSVYDNSDEEFMYEFSDYDSDFSDQEEESDGEDYEGEESEDDLEPGDIKGIPEGCGEEYLITQPAIDDVDKDFYPNDDSRDEDHLDSCQLGEIYASSGIRRRTENGTTHEIDWALFEFDASRCPTGNRITNGERYYRGPKIAQYPTAVAPVADLGDLEVHCMARTSGLQSGRIMPGLVSVKIYGRHTPSSSYQVAGRLGVPGDSGAWLIDNEHGRACGHVLAWSSRKRVAYICPMDVLLKDIAETLSAQAVCLPGGETIYPRVEAAFSSAAAPFFSGEGKSVLDNGANTLASLSGEVEVSIKDVDSDLADSSFSSSHADPDLDLDLSETKESENVHVVSVAQILPDAATTTMTMTRKEVPAATTAVFNPVAVYSLASQRGSPVDLVSSMERVRISEGVFSQG